MHKQLSNFSKRTIFAGFVAAFAIVGVGTMLAAKPALAAEPGCGGTVLSAYAWLGGKGVTVKSNNSCPGATAFDDDFTLEINQDPNKTYNPPEQYGMAWQCVELAVRLYNYKGWHDGLFNVQKAYQIYDQAAANDMTKMANGSINITSIIPGDMIISGGGDGHVAIVDTVSSIGDKVNVVEQNASTNGKATYNFSNGSLTRSGFPVRGVVHSKLNKWPGAIATWNNATEPDPSWIIKEDFKRYWIPDMTVYECMLGIGFDTKVYPSTYSQTDIIHLLDRVIPINDLDTRASCPVQMPSETYKLKSGEGLYRGQSIKSKNGVYTLTMRDDYRLVLLTADSASDTDTDPDVVWAANSAKTVGGYVKMQTNCNFVARDLWDTVKWQTNTDGQGTNCTLAVQDDGKVVIYNGANGNSIKNIAL